MQTLTPTRCGARGGGQLGVHLFVERAGGFRVGHDGRVVRPGSLGGRRSAGTILVVAAAMLRWPRLLALGLPLGPGD